jgi:hypothetical protein
VAAFWVGVLVTAVAAPAARAAVRVESATACLDVDVLTATLERVLAGGVSRPQSDLHVTITARPSAPGATAITMRVATSAGRVVLDRHYRLSPADCRNATVLLRTVLERFLDGLPTQAWPRPPATALVLAAPAPEPPPRRPRRLEVAVLGAVNGRMLPVGVDGQVGARVALGLGRHLMGGDLVARAGAPGTLGEGQFEVVSAFAAIGWQYDVGGWRPGLAVRAGPVAVIGYGYDVNHNAWLFGVEGVASLARCGRALCLGLEVAASPLQLKAVTADRQQQASLPLLHAGLTWSFVPWAKKW